MARKSTRISREFIRRSSLQGLRRLRTYLEVFRETPETRLGTIITSTDSTRIGGITNGQTATRGGTASRHRGRSNQIWMLIALEDDSWERNRDLGQFHRENRSKIRTERV